MPSGPSNAPAGNCFPSGQGPKAKQMPLWTPPSLRASDPATEIKLYLTLVANQPVRNLLFYILRYEPRSQALMNNSVQYSPLSFTGCCSPHFHLRRGNLEEEGRASLKELCEHYLFNVDCRAPSLMRWAKIARPRPDRRREATSRFWIPPVVFASGETMKLEALQGHWPDHRERAGSAQRPAVQ